MEFIEHDIPGVWEIRPKRFEDARGYFCETYKRSAFAERGIDIDFVQDNRSLSRHAGTVRGLHFQTPPFAQAKLVSVTRGAILDVAVDIRRSSLTFGRHVAVRLDAASGAQLLIPEGFAHGFYTLEHDCEVAYKVSAPYSSAHDRAILWNDPALGLPWPVSAEAATLSDKDARAPLLADAPELF